MARNFRTIKAWERSHQLTLAVYRVTAEFPRDERFGLASQLRRACSSIPTNIAEGAGRTSEAELARFIDMATGSASEVEYQLLLSQDLGYLPRGQYQSLASEVIEIRKMLLAFNKKLRQTS
jgi:four helix bundle protein